MPASGVDQHELTLSRPQQQLRSACFAGLLLLWSVSFYSTLLNMVHIWHSIETFAHCFFILPICLYLIWQKRFQLSCVSVATQPWSLLLLIGLFVLWLVAIRLGIQVMEQFAVLAMLPSLVWLTFGNQVCRVILFPLLFVFFALPFGEFLIPKLQYVTAEMTVYLLRFSGVPVYQEGMFIFIPGTRFEVAWTCSGIRYLLAALSLGCLFAYIHFTRYYKRLLFVLLSIVLPIIANGLRAWSIIMIYHFVDQRIAGDIDHLIYGWFFFSFLIAVLFVIGWWFSEPAELKPASISIGAKCHSLKGPGQFLPLTLVAVGFVAFALHGQWSRQYGQDKQQIALQANALPASAGGWQGPINANFSTWRAEFPNADVTWQQDYQKSSASLSLFSAYYHTEHQGKELINVSNIFYDAKLWQLQDQDIQRFSFGEQELVTRRLKLANGQHSISVFYWYQVGSYQSLGAFSTKLNQLLNAPFGYSSGQVVAIAVEQQNDRQLVMDFLRTHQTELWRWLAQPINQSRARVFAKELANENG
ncbi:exosortase A [Motilimonas sp. E26]|uniref:exosortase A n=1 Tax=Motilimonas sp. E26 TaxID=2865674 RepID=UPI001E53E150|nr:exosortase A [Motilimonas sp. E26]MCE0556613.1 exosortase A [Motilimonas sp. E26]